MTRAELVAFLRKNDHGVVATLAADGRPQSAVVGLAVSDALELVFDALPDTRKVQNVRRDRRISVTVWAGHQTAQLDGVADEPQGTERERLLAVYLATFPTGRERLAWPGLTHVRIRPTWARFSDFGVTPGPKIELVDLGGA
jgi:hypothetical protein